MGPLLETFYNYFKDECDDSPLKTLWNRISKEMRSCTLCVHQHHQAQEMYNTEYVQSCISPLLDVLHMLDEERISLHLKDLNARILRGDYDATHDYGEVVSVMFEVHTYALSCFCPFIFHQSLVSEYGVTVSGHITHAPKGIRIPKLSPNTTMGETPIPLD